MISLELAPTTLQTRLANALTWSYPILAMLALVIVWLLPPREDSPPNTTLPTGTVPTSSPPTQQVVSPPTWHSPPPFNPPAPVAKPNVRPGAVTFLVVETKRLRSQSAWSQALADITKDAGGAAQLGTPLYQLVTRNGAVACDAGGRLPSIVDPFDDADWSAMLNAAAKTSASGATRQVWLIDSDVRPPEDGVTLPKLPENLRVTIAWTGYNGDAAPLPGFSSVGRTLFSLRSTQVDEVVLNTLIRQLKK